MNTSKLLVIAGAALVVASCAGHDDREDTATTTAALVGSSAGGTSFQVYVALEAPNEPCAGDALPVCPAGNWLRVLNGDSGPRLVSKLDLSQLPLTVLEQALGAGKDKLIFRGQFGPNDSPATGYSEFIAFEAWRGLPDVPVTPNDRYFAVETINDVPFADVLNLPVKQPVAGVAVDFAPPFVDRGWLTSRVMTRGAVVLGHVAGMTLEAAQVYLRLPELKGPCPMYRILCGDRTATYERDDNRCLLPTGCVVRTACPLVIPACQRGYRLVDWATLPHGCPEYACDPEFIYR